MFNNSPKPTGLEHTMPKLTTPRHDVLQDAVLDFFICGGRQRPMHAFETCHEPLPVVERSYGTKRSRQAVDDATRLTMKRHGWKQTGRTSSLWAFEHRWSHRRDRAEGRNHCLASN